MTRHWLSTPRWWSPVEQAAYEAFVLHALTARHRRAERWFFWLGAEAERV